MDFQIPFLPFIDFEKILENESYFRLFFVVNYMQQLRIFKYSQTTFALYKQHLQGFFQDHLVWTIRNNQGRT